MRPALLNPLFCPVTSLKGVGDQTAKWIGLLCGHRVLDLLFHFPTNVKYRPVYETKMPSLGQLVTFPFTPHQYVIPRNKRMPFCVSGETSFGVVELIFFHSHKGEVEQRLPLEKTVWVSGVLQNKNAYFSMIHPDYIWKDQKDILSHEVVYPLMKGARNTVLIRLIETALMNCPQLSEWQDEKWLKSNHWPHFKEALTMLHHPVSDTDLSLFSPARQRLAYDELLANQLALLLVRQKNRHQQGLSFPLKNTLKLDLPFSLTQAQKKVLSEISADLASKAPMCRLLQGDVGSGKTIVALLSALQVIENHYQVALMAPTDILARQHYQKVSKLLAPLNIKVSLLTAREKGKKRAQILHLLASGELSLLIGTHALIEEEIQFKNLGLAVIDEQHRFGVNQRLKLAKKQSGVNLLLMTATPIPRSLAMTFYGDMDVSLLDEKPAGRTPIITRMMSLKKIPEVMQKLKWWPNQVYWVCPLVEESEKSDLMAVKARFDELRQVFPFQVGLVHGKMKGEEKEAVMADFVAGKIKILVSTTVIEVGVDVPNASLIIIEQAERFGLATLHQLRGRVGRGSLTSICLLLYGCLSENGRRRLELLRETEDGFQIAEADLEMRGAGEVLGWRQSGWQDFKVARLPEHTDLLKHATIKAKEILETDPTLSTEQGQALRKLLYVFEKETCIHTLKAG